MANDPSSPYKKLVPEWYTRNFAHISYSYILVPDFSRTRNFDLIWTCSVLYDNLELHDWKACLSLVTKFCLHFAHSVIICNYWINTVLYLLWFITAKSNKWLIRQSVFIYHWQHNYGYNSIFAVELSDAMFLTPVSCVHDLDQVSIVSLCYQYLHRLLWALLNAQD